MRPTQLNVQRLRRRDLMLLFSGRLARAAIRIKRSRIRSIPEGRQ
jgi:hypothetical protein